jgi:hypothetical protein
MKTLILNSTNILPNTNNSNLTYRFPTSVILEAGQKLALTSFSMYNSTFNITAENQNNSLEYVWFNGITYTITFPDGFYDIVAINNFIHSVMLTNGHYLIQTSNNYYVYFLTITTNSTYYSVELNSFGLNQQLATTKGWTLPPNPTWVIPTITTQYIYPMFNILSNNFTHIIGLGAGYYPLGTAQATITTDGATTWTQPTTATAPYGKTSVVSFDSTFAPQVSPVASYTITCSLINNKYSVPNSLLYSFGIPQTATFGSYFTIQPPQMSFIDILAGTYSEFLIQILDQNLRAVNIQDPQIVILLNISDPAEHGIMK